MKNLIFTATAVWHRTVNADCCKRGPQPPAKPLNTKPVQELKAAGAKSAESVTTAKSSSETALPAAVGIKEALAAKVENVKEGIKVGAEKTKQFLGTKQGQMTAGGVLTVGAVATGLKLFTPRGTPEPVRVEPPPLPGAKSGAALHTASERQAERAVEFHAEDEVFPREQPRPAAQREALKPADGSETSGTATPASVQAGPGSETESVSESSEASGPSRPRLSRQMSADFDRNGHVDAAKVWTLPASPTRDAKPQLKRTSSVGDGLGAPLAEPFEALPTANMRPDLNPLTRPISEDARLVSKIGIDIDILVSAAAKQLTVKGADNEEDLPWYARRSDVEEGQTSGILDAVRNLVKMLGAENVYLIGHLGPGASNRASDATEVNTYRNYKTASQIGHVLKTRQGVLHDTLDAEIKWKYWLFNVAKVTETAEENTIGILPENIWFVSHWEQNANLDKMNAHPLFQNTPDVKSAPRAEWTPPSWYFPEILDKSSALTAGHENQGGWLPGFRQYVPVWNPLFVAGEGAESQKTIAELVEDEGIDTFVGQKLALLDILAASKILKQLEGDHLPEVVEHLPVLLQYASKDLGKEDEPNGSFFHPKHSSWSAQEFQCQLGKFIPDTVCLHKWKDILNNVFPRYVKAKIGGDWKRVEVLEIKKGEGEDIVLDIKDEDDDVPLSAVKRITE